jgi:hypothetical protein
LEEIMSELKYGKRPKQKRKCKELLVTYVP